MAASFVHSAGSVVFSRAPLRPPRSRERIQPREATAVGFPLVYDSVGGDDLIFLTVRATDAERELLQFFFTTLVRARSNTFTYTDVGGAVKTVRFHQDALDWREVAYNAHQTQCLLRVQP